MPNIQNDFYLWALRTLDAEIKSARKDDDLEEAIRLAPLYKHVIKTIEVLFDTTFQYKPSMWTTDTLMVLEGWEPGEYIRGLNIPG